MVEKLIVEIEQQMINLLNNMQMEELHKVLLKKLQGLGFIDEANNKNLENEEPDYCNIFICAKRVEGCSEKSIKYYKSTIENMLKALNKQVKHITTEDLRGYLGEYYKRSNCSKINIDNIRRILSTFFSWLEDENYILKSPVRRIHKIRTGKIVKETYTDENLEIMRDNCKEIRDLEIIDLLNSTGIRVGELVKLDIDDIDFNERECIVEGKGDKQRKVYFDAKTKIHLQNYINGRADNNKALFVSLIEPYNRLNISGVEIRMRALGRKLNINKVHPHKFRRTLATRAIDKGMPIEQVQHLLGHQKIDTTLQYAMVSQNNVKISHRKYIG
jgi:site-specific recombinase XerD